VVDNTRMAEEERLKGPLTLPPPQKNPAHLTPNIANGSDLSKFIHIVLVCKVGGCIVFFSSKWRYYLGM
jgi:hypothetical protein